MRRINLKLLTYSLGCLVLLAGGTVLTHYLQSERIARALLQQADRAENQGHPAESSALVSVFGSKLQISAQKANLFVRMPLIFRPGGKSRPSGPRGWLSAPY